MTCLRDADIRQPLAQLAARAYPGAQVLHEVGLLHGQCRVDVAALSPTCLHGWEIKGDTDSLKRLPAQVDAYSRVLDRCTLVVGDVHIAAGLALVPAWWGVLSAAQVKFTNFETRESVAFEVVRQGADNPFREHPSTVSLLWRGEAEALLEELGAARGLRGKPRQRLYSRLNEVLPPAELRARVRQVVSARGDWRLT
ncbi:sce7726 family protein [Myxococcus virescens]|uniref:Sce7726 family protein n=1 Tax=Myxococcus virescens TaxID=83456 RepID=A0A511HNM8_9BACT|nr:sce7726 family protein [Myxococcus virescens]GEL75187.1 hypothetical protein MVI01_69710 [Myxococcus virescens]SDD64772.1 hypothetical protein SAMN04488504_102112 [Myxococcus virescens]